MTNINSKEFLTKKVLKVNYKRVKAFMGNKSVKYCMNFLQQNFGLFDNTAWSLKDVKIMFLSMFEKFKTRVRKDQTEDKYHQRGMNKFYNSIKNFFNKIWSRALSIICSVSANVVVYVLGYMHFQSLMIALVLGSIYTTVTLGIKYSSANKNNTNIFYEPGNISMPKVDSIVNFIKFTGKLIKDTVVKVFNWFFYKIDKTDNKEVTIRYRRWFLLSIIILLLLVLILI